MKSKILLTVSFVIILLTASFAFAQDKKNTGDKKIPAAAVVKGFNSELISLITSAEERYVALAEAIPEEKYVWRPGKGVRSFGEVFTHMIGANFGLPNFFGAKSPKDAPKNEDLAKLTDKKEIIAKLKASFEHTRNAVDGMSDADLEKSVKFFGNDTTYRGVISFMNAHTNQHLGQLIAYARVNDIVPPWSAAQN